MYDAHEAAASRYLDEATTVRVDSYETGGGDKMTEDDSKTRKVVSKGRENDKST